TRLASLVGSAIFAVHPLFSGSVSYIAGRSSLLCGVFYFLAILLFLKGIETGRTLYRALWLVSAVAAAGLAWSTKQEAITLPFFLAAYVWIRGGAKRWRCIVLFAVVPLAVLFAFRRDLSQLFDTVSRNNALVLAGYEPALPFPAYLRTYVTAVVAYVFPKFIWPSGLNVDPDV